jgi:hypothetical protein
MSEDKAAVCPQFGLGTLRLKTKLEIKGQFGYQVIGRSIWKVCVCVCACMCVCMCVNKKSTKAG